MTSDDDPPDDGIVYGRPLGLHAVRDEPLALGDLMRGLLGDEIDRAGPATRAWLEQVVAQANDEGSVTLDGDELRAALEADAGNVTHLRRPDGS